MNISDMVRVFPHGSPDQSAIGKVLIISKSETAIAVGFEDKPPFCSIEDGMFVGPMGIVLMAHREQMDGVPIGPWIEVVGGGRYEIEETK